MKCMAVTHVLCLEVGDIAIAVMYLFSDSAAVVHHVAVIVVAACVVVVWSAVAVSYTHLTLPTNREV